MPVSVLDLFSGIGGFSLGLERAGMTTIAFCEKDRFCQSVLKKHWPEVPVFEDVKALNHEKLKQNGIKAVDVVCGGFPCQPFSIAGNQRGTEDDRWLWPEMFRLITETNPDWVIAENVANFANMGLETTISDLEGQGYEVGTFIIPAIAVGAEHRRDRVWIVAENASSSRRPRLKPPPFMREKRQPLRSFMQNIRIRKPSLARVYRGNNGIPNRVDRIRALGNAVVPQIPYIIGKAIMEIESNQIQ